MLNTSFFYEDGFYIAPFLARDSIHTSALLSPVRPLCPSVRHLGGSVKTVEVRIRQLSPKSSPVTLVSSWLTSPQNFKGNVGSGAPNERGVGKIRNFQPRSCRISETVQDITKVTRRTNTKSHMRFRLVPKSSTLDDLERPIRTLLQQRCVF